MSLFSSRPNASLRLACLRMYRHCLRVIRRLEPDHQRTWHHYARLKFAENTNERSSHKIKALIADAYEQINWTETLLNRKEKAYGTTMRKE